MVPVSVSLLPFLSSPFLAVGPHVTSATRWPWSLFHPSTTENRRSNRLFSVEYLTMTKSPFSQQEDLNFSSQLDWVTFEDRQLVDAHMINASQTPPASHNATPARTIPRVSCNSPATRPQTQPEPDKLRFLQRDEWNEHNSYEEKIPTYIHYSIEWKVIVNNKEPSKDTEQDLVLIPIAY
jgi:hypothetical protein